MAQRALKTALRACVREKVSALSAQDRAAESIAIAAKVRAPGWRLILLFPTCDITHFSGREMKAKLN